MLTTENLTDTDPAFTQGTCTAAPTLLVTHYGADMHLLMYTHSPHYRVECDAEEQGYERFPGVCLVDWHTFPEVVVTVCEAKPKRSIARTSRRVAML